MTKARDIASAIPAPSTVSSAELGYLDGVTSAIQTQIDTKAPSSTAVTLTDTQTLTNKTLTNPVIASVVNNTLTSTTGDMIYASGANTPTRLGIGSSAQVLTVASGVPAWATPSSGGMTLLSTTTLSGATTTISGINQTYNILYGVVYGVTNATANGKFRIAPNGVTNISTTIAGSTNLSVDRNEYFYLTDDTAGQTLLRTDANNSWSFIINNYASTTNYKSVSARGTYFATTDSNRDPWMSMGGIDTNSAISSLVFSNSGGNLSTGTVLLYGVK